MKKYILKVFPLEFGRKFSEAEIKRIKKVLLEEWSTSIIPESFQLQEFHGIQFLDCGNNLKRVTCPLCGKSIDLKKWHEFYDDAFSKEYDPMKNYDLPCEHSFPLHALKYKEKCGFATCVISVEVITHIWTGWIHEFPWFGLVDALYEE